MPSSFMYDLGAWDGCTARQVPDRYSEGQEFLIETIDFRSPSTKNVEQGVCPLLDGACRPYGSDYCGGCGECMIMQAVHYGYTLERVWRRARLTHRLAWHDATEDLRAVLDREGSVALG